MQDRRQRPKASRQISTCGSMAQGPSPGPPWELPVLPDLTCRDMAVLWTGPSVPVSRAPLVLHQAATSAGAACVLSTLMQRGCGRRTCHLSLSGKEKPWCLANLELERRYHEPTITPTHRRKRARRERLTGQWLWI